MDIKRWIDSSNAYLEIVNLELRKMGEGSNGWYMFYPENIKMELIRISLFVLCSFIKEDVSEHIIKTFS